VPPLGASPLSTEGTFASTCAAFRGDLNQADRRSKVRSPRAIQLVRSEFCGTTAQHASLDQGASQDTCSASPSRLPKSAKRSIALKTTGAGLTA